MLLLLWPGARKRVPWILVSSETQHHLSSQPSDQLVSAACRLLEESTRASGLGWSLWLESYSHHSVSLLGDYDVGLFKTLCQFLDPRGQPGYHHRLQSQHQLSQVEMSSLTVGHFSCPFPIPKMDCHKIFPAAQLRIHIQGCYIRLYNPIVLCT